jgi:AraC family transcriptional regulator of adaptative response/methylated-DNA-[protein]-cysteine methyltransferase
LRNQPISGVGELIRSAIGECSLGSIIAAVTEKGICAILLGDNPSILRRELQEHFKVARLVDSDRELGT